MDRQGAETTTHHRAKERKQTNKNGRHRNHAAQTHTKRTTKASWNNPSHIGPINKIKKQRGPISPY